MTADVGAPPPVEPTVHIAPLLGEAPPWDVCPLPEDTDYVLVVSPHAQLRPGAVEALVRTAQATADRPGPRAVVARAQALLALPDDADDTSWLTVASLPPQAALIDVTDLPKLIVGVAESTPAADGVAALVGAATTVSVTEDTWVVSTRPNAMASAIRERVPGTDPFTTPGLVLQASQAPMSVGIPAAVTWLRLSACDMPGASEALAQWRLELAALPPRVRDALPRLLRRRDQLAAEILQEARLAPAAAEEARIAITGADPRRAAANLRDTPGSYPAAVAVVALAHRPDDDLVDAQPLIPRVIVQGWFDSPLPDDAQALTASWRFHHREWDHEFFDTDRAARWIRASLGAHAEQTFLSASPVGKSNLFRYAYLAECGGLWADVDDRALAPLDGVLAGRSLVVIRESLGAVADNILGVAPGHPVLAATRDEAFRNVAHGFAESPWLANGPGLLTRHVAAWLVHGAARAAYAILPGYRLAGRVSMHEGLAYKETTLAWDVPRDIERIPAHWSDPWAVPRPLSRRQHQLASTGGV